EHILNRKTQPATHRLAELIVQLEQRNAVGAQALEAFDEAALDRAAQIGQVAVLDPHLGGDVRPRRQHPDIAPDRLFGRAVTIKRRGVDPVDAGFDCVGQRRDASRLLAPDQQSTGIATTEGNFRNFEASAAEKALSHTLSLSAPESRSWRLRTQPE